MNKYGHIICLFAHLRIFTKEWGEIMNKKAAANCLILGGLMVILGAAGGSDANSINVNEIIIYLLCGFVMLFVGDLMLSNKRQSE